MRRLIMTISCAIIIGCGSSAAGGGGGGYAGGGGASSGGGSSGGGGVACAQMATAVCGKMFGCIDAVSVPWFGDKATCEVRFKLTCEKQVALPDISPTFASSIQACAATLSGGCEVMQNPSVLKCLNPAGLRQNGNACSSNVQCTSAFCKQPPGEDCGVCGPKVSAGGACGNESDACEGNLTCIGGTCGTASLVAGGEACDDKTKLCNFGFGCVGNVCKKQGDGGDACDPAANHADCRLLDKLLYCKADAKTCAKFTVADPGGDCSDGATLCKSGVCVAGACKKRAGDGESCDESAGTFCMLPAKCVKGLCSLPSASKCN